MGNDTKLGVLVGLVIVVVASVYFYGSSEEDGDLFVSPTVDTGPPQIPDGPRESLETAQRPTPSFGAAPFENVSIPSANGRSPAGEGGTAVPGDRSAWSDRLANADRLRPILDNRRFQNRPPGRPAESVPDTGATNEEQGAIAGSSNPDRGAPEPSNRPGEDAADRPWRFTGRPATPLRTRASDALTAATAENLDSREPTTAAPPVGRAREVRRSGAERPTDTTARRGDANADSAGRRRSAAPGSGAPWPKHHRLRPRETLSDVARDYYGSTTFVSLILRANPDIKDPRRIRENTEITLPNPARASPGSPLRRTRSVGSYLVRKNDSFYSIAKRVFGDGRRWHDIYKLNKALVKNNPKGLKPDMTIRLPSP